MIRVEQSDLEQMLERAAEEGAKRALARVGLHDEKAGDDLNDLRKLLDSWRQAKRSVLDSVIKAVTKAVLIAMAVGVAFYLKLDFWTK